jgi:hypothetical protein
VDLAALVVRSWCVNGRAASGWLTAVGLASAAFATFAATSSADIGLVKVSRTSAPTGAVVFVTYAGYTHPWPHYPLYLVPASRAPGLVACAPDAICDPRVRWPPQHAPYILLGRIRYRQKGTGTLRFRVPNVARGAYRFVLYCAPCYRGPGGTLIVDRDVVFRIER